MGSKLAVVSTGANRLACAQPSQGRPWSPWVLPYVLVEVGVVLVSEHRWRRWYCSHWLQPTQGTAASAWCRSTGCQDWWLHRVVQLGWAACWAAGKGAAMVLWVAMFWFCYPGKQKRGFSAILGWVVIVSHPIQLPEHPLFFLSSGQGENSSCPQVTLVLNVCTIHTAFL